MRSRRRRNLSFTRKNRLRDGQELLHHLILNCRALDPSIDHSIVLTEVAVRGELMPRVRTDGCNENEVEAEPQGEGEHLVGVAMVVSSDSCEDCN